MGLKEKLDLIESCKSDIRNKIIDKGVYVPESTPFSKYPEYINNIEASPIAIDNDDEWKPDPEWWDIEKILEEDTNTGDYEYLNDYKKMIILYDDENLTKQFTINSTTSTSNGYPHAVKTSDGVIYNTSGTKSHTWDTTKDKSSSYPDVKTRYAIFYFNPLYYTSNVSIVSSDWTYMNKDCLFIVSNMNIGASTNAIDLIKLRALKMKGEAYFRSRYDTAGSSNIPAFNTPLLEHFSQETHSNNYNFLVMLLGSRNLKCFKFNAENYFYKNETTGEFSVNPRWKNIDQGIAHYIHKMDVSEIDFTNHAKTIFYPHFYTDKIKGIINLSGNTLNTEYDIFTGNASRFPMEFSLILPPNAYVKLRCGDASYASLKFLVENAPTITEKHTLAISSNSYQKLRCMNYEYPIMYNGDSYLDGVQVLTLKGWTVTTV